MGQNNISDDKTTEYKPTTSSIRIGILIKNNHLLRILKMQRPILKYQFINAASKRVQATLYFFSLESIDGKKKLVNGVFYNDKRMKWEEAQFPYPQVIYKTYGSKRGSVATKKLKTLLANEGIININLLYCFDKWDLHQLLYRDRGIKKHLPATRLYTGPESLRDMLNEGNPLYLKDINSGKGRGIFRIERLSQGGYSFSYFINNLYSGRIKSFNGLINKINSFYMNKPFIMQAAIKLLEVNDKKIDIRAELQRDGNNRIVMAGLVIRVGNQFSPITTHGTCYEFDSFLKGTLNYSNSQINKIRRQIISVTKKIYLAIENAYGSTSELSIDLGLDIKGNLWFIESNAYSGKVSYFKIYSDKDLIESFVKILEYSNYRFYNSLKDAR